MAGRGLDLDGALRVVDNLQTARVAGKVTEMTGLVLRATAPGARAGELVIIDRQRGEPLRAEVVGFRGEEVVLLPLGEAAGVGPDSVVRPTGRPFAIRCGPSLLGRVLDGLGEPIDNLSGLASGRLAPEGLELWPVERAAPDPLRRRRITAPLALGVRALDGCLTVGEGQRIGLFAGPGLGKSTLLGQIARHSEAEVNVIALVGERGREVRDFVETQLGEEGLRRSVVVAATSDAPPLLRLKSALVATAIAEHFRDRGKRVLLLLDSLTRVARAQREVGLAAGEPPARQGFPPSVFAMLPRLLERTGQSERGSITAVYAVLTAEGEDMDDPVADEVRAILDGHIWLSRDLAARNHWPAIDVVRSLSRVMDDIVDEPHRAAAANLRAVISTYERQRDLILLGAYRRGTDEDTDYALDSIDDAYGFLRQARDERQPFDVTRKQLISLFGG
ncbi:MAG: FliI/YscN family ATPase [Myxococcales bacterium]|nr:FliI/YscN family ATPase [Myxococcales bacterium]